MIVHVTTPWNNRTFTAIINGPARAAGVEMRSMTYPELAGTPLEQLPRATWIFSDTDLLDPTPSFPAARAWRQLADRGDRMLNHPTRSMGRYELLRTLYEEGINAFDVYRATDPRRPRRYPVFLRWINAHSGPISPLLRDRDALERYLAWLLEQGRPRDAIIAVEFCDTRESNGLVRQFGAYRIGDRIIPEHLWYSTEWAIKAQEGWNVGVEFDIAPLAEEERRYVADNPHEADLRRIFDLARMEYGRIDYGMLDGRIQVWEINSNPLMTIEWRPRVGRDSAAILERFMARFIPALVELS